jgi:hypothetical protein
VLPRELQQALSEQEISALLASRQDIASSLAEDLLAHFSQQQKLNTDGGGASGRSDLKPDRNLFASLGSVNNSQFLAESQKWRKKKDVKKEDPVPIPKLSLNMTAEQVLTSSRGLGMIIRFL